MINKNGPSNKTGGDFINSFVEATVGATPVVGSFLPEFFVNVIAPPIEIFQMIMKLSCDRYF